MISFAVFKLDLRDLLCSQQSAPPLIELPLAILQPRLPIAVVLRTPTASCPSRPVIVAATITLAILAPRRRPVHVSVASSARRFVSGTRLVSVASSRRRRVWVAVRVSAASAPAVAGVVAWDVGVDVCGSGAWA